MRDSIPKIAPYLVNQQDEPEPFSGMGARGHYWRDRCISGARSLEALADSRALWRKIAEYEGHSPVLVVHRAKGHWYGPAVAFIDVTGTWRASGSIGGSARLAFEPTHFMETPAPPEEAQAS